MKTSAAVYVILVLLIGAGLLAADWARPDLATATLPLTVIGFWFFFSLAGESFWLETPTKAGMVSMSLAVNVASLFLLPHALVLAVGAFSVLVSDLLLHRRGRLRASFNAAQMVISLAVTLAVVHLLAGRQPLKGSTLFLECPQAVLAAPVVFFAVNTLLVSVVLSLNQSASLWKTWRENYGFGYQFLSSGTLSVIGLILVVSFDSLGYVTGLLFLLLFFFIRDSYHRYARERAQKLGVV